MENLTESPGCCYTRHVPVDTSNLEHSTVHMMKELEARAPNSKAFFHPTDSIVFY